MHTKANFFCIVFPHWSPAISLIFSCTVFMCSLRLISSVVLFPHWSQAISLLFSCTVVRIFRARHSQDHGAGQRDILLILVQCNCGVASGLAVQNIGSPVKARTFKSHLEYRGPDFRKSVYTGPWVREGWYLGHWFGSNPLRYLVIYVMYWPSR